MDPLRYAFLTMLVVGLAAAFLLRVDGGTDDPVIALDPVPAAEQVPTPVAPDDDAPEPPATDTAPATPSTPEDSASPDSETGADAPAQSDDQPPTAGADDDAAGQQPPLAVEPVDPAARAPLYAEVLRLLATADHPDERSDDDPARLVIDPVLVLDGGQTETMDVDARRAVLDLLDGPARFEEAPAVTGGPDCNPDQAIVSLAVPFVTEDGGAQMLARVQPDCGGAKVIGYTFAPVLGGEGFSVTAKDVLDEQPA